MVLTQPRVSGDSLIGALQGVSYQVGVPLSHVQRMEAVQRDKTRTAWLIAGLTALTAASMYALVHASGVGDGCDTTFHRHMCPGTDIDWPN